MRIEKKIKRNRRRIKKTMQSAANRVIQSHRPITVPGLTIRLHNVFRNGPFTIKMLTVKRRRQGEEVEVDQRWLVDCYEAPILHGTRAQLERQLKRYNFQYLKYIMTKDTAAEGM